MFFELSKNPQIATSVRRPILIVDKSVKVTTVKDKMLASSGKRDRAST